MKEQEKNEHRICLNPVSHGVLLDVIARVGIHAHGFTNVPVNVWLKTQTHVDADDEWFYPGVDMDLLQRLRN